MTRWRWPDRRLAAAILGALLLPLVAPGPVFAALPPGFSDSLVVGVAIPTALAFTPDGRLLVTTQDGNLRVVQGGGLLATPALTFPASAICTESERGLLGVAVDPDFTTNTFIYLFYTFEKPAGAGCVNRVSRFTLPAGRVVDPATELILVDNMPSPNGNHNAGDVQFGKDGFLYVSIGEGGIDSAARLEHVLTGKILRITKDGGIPAGNPFQGAGTARCNVTGQTTPGNRCQETFAWGLRNPFRIAFDPNEAGTRFFINDVGAGSWEEIDLGQPGVDYGWNCREGAHTFSASGACNPTPPGMVDPFFEYSHVGVISGTTATNCRSITGGAFVPDGLWPGFDGAYLFADFICGWIFKLTESAGAWSATDFATALGGNSAVHLRFGPHGGSQALYYTTYAGGGQVRRIAREPTELHTLLPCRAIDTRNPDGPLGGPALQGGQERLFTLAGVCGVSATAREVVVNLTVVGATASGFLQAYAADTGPGGTSVLNFGPARARANNAFIRMVAGQIAVRAGLPPEHSTHFIADVVGYLE